MGKVDRYLLQAFDAAEREAQREAEATGQPGPEVIRLPMLIRVKETSWNPGTIPDFDVIAQLGNIITGIGSLRTVTALQSDPGVLSIEASRPGSGPDSVNSISFIKANVVHGGTISEKGDRALVAIIDSDIDVLHQTFLDRSGKRTRILAVWDQTDPTGPGPAHGAFGKYGTEHTEHDINNYIQNGSVPPGLRRIVAGHGTHVTSIAAGRPIPESDFLGGIAPEASIIVVIPQLTVGVKSPMSLGYSTSHLAALEYIDDFARRVDLPVVVNVSQGMNAGAHDGTSLLEVSFDMFTEGGRAPGRAIVKSAGNERGKGSHAKLNMVSQAIDSLEWIAIPGRRGQDLIELWFRAGNEMKFRLRDPSGATSSQVTWFSPLEESFFPSGNRYHISYDRYHPDNGDSRLLVTIAQGRALAISPGMWVLEVESGNLKSAGEIHTWVERNDIHPINFTNHLDEEMTLSIPGTTNNVICVGSVAPSKPFRLATYSSYGPTRDGRNKPDLVAPGEEITGAKGNSLADVVTMSGTSMAAAHVTGAIALLFSYWEKQSSRVQDWERLNAAQVRAAVNQMTMNYTGYWECGMGYGILDVQELLSTFG